MLAFVCLSIAMAISACYELVEWGAALALGQGGEEFLGTQGYVWDTQSEMWYALLGASASLILSGGGGRRLCQRWSPWGDAGRRTIACAHRAQRRKRRATCSRRSSFARSASASTSSTYGLSAGSPHR